VLALPGVLKGALEVRARTINEKVKLAAARAIAGVIPEEEREAVAAAAIATGAGSCPLAWAAAHSAPLEATP
jgi:malate dehydrogenase (oxaloacetate-decarboxylating)